VINLDASEVPVLLSVDQTDEDMYTITWRKDDNDLIVAQGDAESVKAILGDATHAALSEQEDAVTPIQAMEMNHEAYELFGSLERVESNVEESTILAKSGKVIKTALWDTVVSLSKFAEGFNNQFRDMVLGTVDLVMLLGKVPGLSVDAMNYVTSWQFEQQVKSAPEDVAHLVDEISKMSGEDFDNFIEKLDSHSKEYSENNLEYMRSSLKQLATDPETQGRAVFEVLSIVLPFLKASKLGAAGRGAAAAGEVAQGVKGGGAAVATAERKVAQEASETFAREVASKSRPGTEIVYRWMSEAEVIATKETGFMRGGRPGDHYVTDAANSNAKKARQRLALDYTPEVKATIEVPENVFPQSTIVKPLDDMPGGGTERVTTGQIPVKIIDIKKG